MDLVTKLELARRLGYLQVSDEVVATMGSVGRLLNALIRALRTNH